MKKVQWFFEKEVPYDTSRIKIGIEIKKKLYSCRSPYQTIEFFDTFGFGRTLILDGILQTSEGDEFIYHEMLCQTPLFWHPRPKKVLIIGGGDGGALEEVLKHPIEKAVMAEIDKKVVDLSQKYLPSISKGAFKNKRAEVIFADGKEFVKNRKNSFDVIILDLSDPGGPAKDLIALKFYRDVKRALKPQGILSVQSGSLTCQPKLVSLIFKRLNKIFKFVRIHRAVVPSYQAGEYSFAVASDFNLKKVNLKSLKNKAKKLKLKLSYWSPEIHLASAVLPKYLEEIIKK